MYTDNKNQKVKEGFILAFGELFLKSSGVQKILKKRLLNQLLFFLKKEKIDFKIILGRERIFIEAKNFRKVSAVLKKIFGLSWFAKSLFLEKFTLNEVADFVRKNYQDWIGSTETFALRVRKDSSIKERGDKIIEKIAQGIKRKVNLDRPKKEIFIEARKKGWFIYFKKQKGAGGLPMGSQGKVLTLVSGGIDSPVAAYLMAKRGAENIWLHFHSFPLTSRASIEKTEELAKVFLNYQPKIKVHFIPFSEIQKEIKLKIPAKYRVLFYRKIMLEIAQEIAREENVQALVSGESLGQVSSQTLPNFNITQENIKIPIMRPLIALDKEEIINLAKQIGTFEISIKPQEDCCTLFVPKGQTAAGNIETVHKLEKEIKLSRLISQSMRKAQIKFFK
jgi:thiamine biosynthesis protein ThiI